MATPPYAGSVQATTGKATATSPSTGTVVGGAPGEVVFDESAPVEEVEPRRELPHPVRRVSPSTHATGTSTSGVRRHLRFRTGFHVMMHDDTPGRAP